MTVFFDQMIAVGPLRIIALSECTIKVHHIEGTVFITGQKKPVAVLIARGMALTAFAPDGIPMTREHVEKLCPGAWLTAKGAR